MPADDFSTTDDRAARFGRDVVWVTVAIGVHVIAWAAPLAAMCFVVPRQKELFADFEVPLSSMSLMVINISDFVLAFWPFCILAVLAMIIVSDFLVILLFRSKLLRVVLLLALTATPMVLLLSIGTTFLQLQEMLRQLS